jgi:hypothetical protein
MGVSREGASTCAPATLACGAGSLRPGRGMPVALYPSQMVKACKRAVATDLAIIQHERLSVLSRKRFAGGAVRRKERKMFRTFPSSQGGTSPCPRWPLNPMTVNAHSRSVVSFKTHTADTHDHVSKEGC